MTFLLVPLSFLTIVCYALDVVSPVWLSMLLSCSLVALLLAKNSMTHGLLTFYFVVLYGLPFIHGFEYIGFDFESNDRPTIMWGLLTNDYTFSKPIIERLFMLGSLGLLAMVSGVLLFNRGRPGTGASRAKLSDYASQSLPRFLLLLSLAFLLSWLSMPKDSILLHSYGSSGSIANPFNFNASWLLSYIILVALFIDQEFMQNSRKQRLWKRVSLLGSVLYIVAFHQFSRGDRECVTLLAAFALLFMVRSFQAYSAQAYGPKLLTRKFIGLAVFCSLIFVTANIIGSLRSILSLHLSDKELSESIRVALSRIYAGTWSAVLLTPLSVVGDFFTGNMNFRLGSTYIDSLLSLIPSPIARWIDYTRPIEGTHGPAWDMRFGIGGTHILVVPYMNFGVVGLYCFMFLQGAMFSWLDRAVRYNNNFSKIFLFGSLIVIGPHWYWYGDMSLVRGVMAYAITWLLYCFLAFKVPRPQLQQLS